MFWLVEVRPLEISQEKVQTLKQNEWIIIWNNISILLSAVGNAEKKKLTENVSKIGGKVVSVWTEDVAYLVMEKVKFTQKASSRKIVQFSKITYILLN